MKTKEEAIKFFSEYFNCSESETKDCHHLTIDCMVKFANTINDPDVVSVNFKILDVATLCSYKEEIILSVGLKDKQSMKRIFKALKPTKLWKRTTKN